MIEPSLILTEEEYKKAILEAEIELAVFSQKYGIPMAANADQILPDLRFPEEYSGWMDTECVHFIVPDGMIP